MRDLKRLRGKTLKERVLDIFKEYGGWWKVEGMAEWLGARIEDIRAIYDKLEAEGLMDRRS